MSFFLARGLQIPIKRRGWRLKGPRRRDREWEWNMWSHVGDEQRVIHVSFILKYFAPAPPPHSRRRIPPFIRGSSFLQPAYLSLECFQSRSRLVCRLILLLLPMCERARLKRRCCLSRLVKTEIPSSTPPPSSHFFSFFLSFLLFPWRPAHKVSSCSSTSSRSRSMTIGRMC